MPRFDVTAVRERTSSDYSAPFDEPMSGRIRQTLGKAGNLTDFGVKLVHLPSGVWSSHRH